VGEAQERDGAFAQDRDKHASTNLDDVLVKYAHALPVAQVVDGLVKYRPRS
jgi:hypothetical protein